MATDAALEFISGISDFIQASPTSYHAAAEIARQLSEAEFTQLDEKVPWHIKAGGYFFVRDGAVIAWVVPHDIDQHTGFRVVGSHTDSPGFKLKPHATTTTAGWQQAGMEVYGGPLLNSWLDRELGLAGRLTTLDGRTHLVRTGPLLRIAQLAPHLDRSVNESLHLDRQAHLMPLFSVANPDADVSTVLADQVGVAASEVAFHEVFACPTETPGTFGWDQEFFACWRLDNLSSVYPSLVALQQAEVGHDIAVMACFDHEEIGSESRSGASGPVLADALQRIAHSLGHDGDRFHAMIARSSCISADAGHAVHPNYVGMHDPNNRPLVNGGPLLKINANQRYSTDAVGAALWMRACDEAGVPTQTFVSNNAVPCGSTIGPLTASRLGMTTVDVGIPLLSMHSAREMCGGEDPLLLARVLEAYWAGA